MTDDATPAKARLTDGLGAWQPIETAPASGLILLAVEGRGGERRTFAAEASHEDGAWVWNITTGWGGWTRLHAAWTPILWQHLPQAPSAALTGPLPQYFRDQLSP